MSQPFKISMSGRSHHGGRNYNEDAFAVLLGHGFAMVADGMGGLDRGELASKTVVDTIVDAVERGEPVIDAAQLAHTRLLGLRRPNSAERLGSTMVSIALAGSEISIAWVGDSRAYLLRNGLMSMVTRDHSLVFQLMAAGAITEAEAASHPQKHILTRALGTSDSRPAIDSLKIEARPGDRFLLCSDGLCGYVPDLEIAQELDSGSAAEVSERLIERAVRIRNTGDNVTVVVILIEA